MDIFVGSTVKLIFKIRIHYKIFIVGNKIGKPNFEIGYSEAVTLAKSHYENFPVVSSLIPGKLKNDIAIIYWFARTADDYSDEGNIRKSERLEKLTHFENRLRSLLSDEPLSNLEAALKNTIIVRKLNPEYFFKLIKAFKQDVAKTRYQNFNELLDYCSNSANPVGRLLLELFEVRNEKAFFYSDRICTALQITNFIQDTKIDFEKGRIYYPLDEMEKFSVTEKLFEMKEISPNLKQLIEFNVVRTQALFDEGKGLLEFLSGKFKYEINWTIKGGEEILKKVRGADFDVFSKRPFLSKSDYLRLFFKSLLN
jgi:squalene synthase HpnC